jgi:cysteine-rich repeat protein
MTHRNVTSVRFVLATTALLTLLAVTADATTITIVSGDSPGEGLEDTTPAAPVGGNPGTTRGAQRLNAFQAAADIWAGILPSSVPITVLARFNPLGCGSSGVLGNGGPSTLHLNFAGAPRADTLYPQALANKFAGIDLDPGTDDIRLTFNSDIGAPGCMISFYLGLDGAAGTGQFDLLSVALHELGHGLGFGAQYNVATGAKNAGFDDIFMIGLEDHSTTKFFPDMTDAERVTAATDTGDLHWAGPVTVASSGFLTSGRHASGHVEMYAPATLQLGSSVSHFSTSLTPNQLMEPIYTTALHDVGLSTAVLVDIGWGGCGDTNIDAGEQCDDGNVLDGDCCSSTCQFEGAAAPCDDGDACSSGDACDGAGTCVSTPVGDGGACSDGDPCTFGETCTSDVCGGGTAYSCPLCEACDGSGTCADVPQTTPACHLTTIAHKAALAIADKTPDTGDAVAFKWSGQATTLPEFGNPVAVDDYALCIYAGPTPTLIFRALAPAGGLCTGKSCWVAGKGVKYKDKDATPDGVLSIGLKPGPNPKAKAAVKSRGVNLTGRPFGLPTTPLAPAPVRVQLQSGNGQCWQATFSTFGKNVAGSFKAKSD